MDKLRRKLSFSGKSSSSKASRVLEKKNSEQQPDRVVGMDVSGKNMQTASKRSSKKKLNEKEDSFDDTSVVQQVPKDITEDLADAEELEQYNHKSAESSAEFAVTPTEDLLVKTDTDVLKSDSSLDDNVLSVDKSQEMTDLTIDVEFDGGKLEVIQGEEDKSVTMLSLGDNADTDEMDQDEDISTTNIQDVKPHSNDSDQSEPTSDIVDPAINLPISTDASETIEELVCESDDVNKIGVKLPSQDSSSENDDDHELSDKTENVKLEAEEDIEGWKHSGQREDVGSTIDRPVEDAKENSTPDKIVSNQVKEVPQDQNVEVIESQNENVCEDSSECDANMKDKVKDEEMDKAQVIDDDQIEGGEVVEISDTPKEEFSVGLSDHIAVPHMVEPNQLELVSDIENEDSPGVTEDFVAKDVKITNDTNETSEIIGETDKHIQPEETEVESCKLISSCDEKPRLEETVRADNREHGSNSSVSAQIREIVTKHLSTEDLTEAGSAKRQNIDALKDENKTLQRELDRMEDLLAATRAEREEIAIKYSALSERLDQLLKQNVDGSDLDEGTVKVLLNQNMDLRRRLEDEHRNFLKKVQTYQDGQKQQAQLVHRLQSKVIQYKQKCDSLELAIVAREREMDESRLRTDVLAGRVDNVEARLSYSTPEPVADFDPSITQLQEESQRCDNLIQVNSLLREQLDAATQANQSLAADVQKLTQDWLVMRDELESKEIEWKDEEQSFNDYFMEEHNRLLSLWQDATKFRREFGEMKTSTERDLSQLRTDLREVARNLKLACDATLQQQSSSHMEITDELQHYSYLSDEHEAARDMSPSELWHRIQELSLAQAAALNERSELLSQFQEIKATNDQLKLKLDEKERMINSLNRNLQDKESDSLSSEMQTTTISGLQSENYSLYNALRDIAKRIFHEVDGADADRDHDHRDRHNVSFMHGLLNQGQGNTLNTSGNDSWSGNILTASMIDSIISNIQSSLNKRFMQVEELNTKLTSAREQYVTVNNKYEDCMEHGRQIEQELQKLKMELDSSFREKAEFNKVIDKYKMKNNTLKDEKDQLEHLQQSLYARIQELENKNGKLQTDILELHKVNESAQDEKETIILESSKHKKSLEISQKTLSSMESKLLKVKEELLTTKETLNKIGLTKDVILLEKEKLGETLLLSEKHGHSLEVELSTLKNTELRLRDMLTKLQADNKMIDHERKELNLFVEKLQGEKMAFAREISELEQEKAGLCEEVLRLEQDKLALIEDKSSLQDAAADAERTQQLLHNDSDRQIREKLELSSQLAAEKRQRESLASDITRLTQELQHRANLLQASLQEKEHLMKEHADIVVRFERADRELKSLSEAISSLRIEKSNLETSLYDSQQLLSVSDTKRVQAEIEKNDVLEKKGNLQAQVKQLFQDIESEKAKLELFKNNSEKRLKHAEMEHLTAMGKTQQEHKKDLANLIKEKESEKQQIEASHQDTLQKLKSQSGELSVQQERKVEAIRRQLEVVQREFQEKISSSEREKETVLSSLRKEKTKLQDKLQMLQKDFQTSQSFLEKAKRDAVTKAEQHKMAVDDLQIQLKELKSTIEDTSTSHEKSVKDLRNQVQESNHQRDVTLQEINSLRGKLQLTEDARETSKKELSDILLKFKESEMHVESLKSEILEFNRQLNDERYEKVSAEKTNEELKNRLKQSEKDKGELKRSLEESFQKITFMESSSVTTSREVIQLRETLQDLEKNRIESHKETQNYRRQIKHFEEELQTKLQEIRDLNSRLVRIEERDENNKKEIFSLKQKLTDADSTREAVRKDLLNLQRKLSESEEKFVLNLQDLKQALDDSKQRGRQLEEHDRHLNELLNIANNNVSDLKLKLSNSEGKIGAMESQLLISEGTKKDAEHKLISIYSSLRRYIGLKAETSGGIGHVKFGSFKKKSSPKRLENEPLTGIAEVNTEIVGNTLRDVMQQITNLEKDKEESTLLINSYKEKLEELDAEKKGVEEKLVQAHKSLGNIQQANQNTASETTVLKKTIVANQETISLLQKERSSMADKISSLEKKVQASGSEAIENQEKMNKLQQNLYRFEKENNTLREALIQVESRVSQADSVKNSLEAEVQRLQMSITDKETEYQVLQDRCETLNRRNQENEEKVISLQITIDRLNMALERSAEGEHELKDKLQSLNKSLTESTSSGWNLQEKIQQLQKALANSENERRVIQERLENSKQMLNESKKSNIAISDRVQQLRAEISNYEDRCRDLDNQIRSSEKLLGQHNDNAQQNLQQIQQLQHEKQVFQNMVADLQRSLSENEVEKQDFHRWHVLLEKDKSALKQTLDKVERERLLSEELATRSSKERTNLDRSFNTLQKDNINLQHRLQSLENQLTEQEKHHSEKLLSLTSRHRQEKDNEIERLRNAQVQAERTLELRERAHRQRVLGLEQQVQLLRDQMNQEIRKRQLYIQQSTSAGNEMKDLRQALDESLKTVSRDSSTLDAGLLEHETRKLDNVVDRHLTTLRPTPILRSRSSNISPVRPLVGNSALFSPRLSSSRGSSKGSLQNL